MKKSSISLIGKTITLLAPSFALLSLSTLSPALASIGQAFPNLSDAAVQMLYTLPSLVGFPLILLSGKLASRFTKKQILVVSLTLMILGGVAPALLHGSYGVLIGASILYGVGFGGLSPMTSALITEHCPVEQQPVMFGFQSAVIGIGSAAFSFLGGVLANIKWWYVYFAYLMLIPILLLTLCLPKGSVVKTERVKGEFVTPALTYYLVFGVLINCFLGAVHTNIAMLVEEFSLGGPEVAGTTMTVFSCASILGGVITGSLMKRVGKYMLPMVSAASMVGMLLFGINGGVPLLLVSACIVGVSFAMRMPAGYMEVTRVTPVEDATMAISLYCCFSQLGTFLAPVVINTLTPGTAVANRFLVAGTLLLGLTVVAYLKEKHEIQQKNRTA